MCELVSAIKMGDGDEVKAIKSHDKRNGQKGDKFVKFFKNVLIKAIKARGWNVVIKTIKSIGK